MSPISYISLLALPILSAVLQVSAGGEPCGPGVQCPSSSAPCCSPYGFCGSGTFCLGGCNPLWSKSLTSCRPEPVCKDATYNMNDMSRILSNATLYDGNVTKSDWIVEGGNVVSTSDGLQLLLTQANNGTKISLNNYVHYGTITAKMRTSKWKGVVTAFITMSDIKDEIDYEWPGTQETQTQLNWFWMGQILTPTVGSTVDGLSSTFDNYHEFTIDWQEDKLRWVIDGNEKRVLQKSDTLNNGQARYPSTPSRVQISIWPGGISSLPQGTVDWAGGLIDWTDPYYVQNGHFDAIVQSVTVQCADSASRAPGIQSYVYGANDTSGIASVVLSNATTVTGAAGALEVGRWTLGSAAVAAVAWVLAGW